MASIEIKTTQNVTIEYDAATLWERLVASLIDGIIVIAMYLFITLVIISAIGSDPTESDQGWFLLIGLLPATGLMLYHFLSEILANGQTWGKKAMGVKVIRLDGKEAGLSDSLLRAVFYIVDGILTLGILGSLLIVSTAKRQRLGDMTANTTVIKLRPNLRFGLDDILRINTLDNYEPMYPQVRQYSEQDMLFIKNVLARYRKHPNTAHRQIINELVEKIRQQLDLNEIPRDKSEFLKTLIRDYIVLTR
ncbi:MAG: RDD family protein [Saprospiraceae bacterium]